jgi:CubicO group peptidase (beta-lactamase class C family)
MRSLLLLAVSVPLLSQDFASIAESARDELRRLNIPGASIAIVRGDRVVFSEGVGVANVETGEPVRAEMLFRLGSTTKMLTATALVGLAVEGKIDLNAPISRYLPNLPPRLAQITANQLLSHTAGILDTAPMLGLHDDDALGKGIRGWTDAWLFTSPGKIFSYSNPGYWLSGYLVETLSGKPYADAMEARVFQPLGMARTTLRPTMAMTWPLAQGHEEGRIARPAADNAASWPAGSVFSNTHDLAQFVIAFLNDGRVDGHRAIDPKIIALLSTPHAKYPDSDESYGYGLTIRDLRGVHIVEHGGSRSGYGSFIRMAPEQRAAIIIQTNRSGANLPATLERASELLLPLAPKTDAKPRTSLAISNDDLRRVAGVYRNGDQRIEIAARDGKLYLKRGAAEDPLEKHSASRYAASRGGEYVMTPAADGSVEYITSGSRSFARMR